MRIVLRKDVSGLGGSFEVVEVKDGYALNNLIPRKLAVPATPSAIKESEARRAQVQQRKELDAKLLVQNLAALADARVVLRAKVNEKGHLYDAVGEPEILAAIKREARVDLPKGVIKLERPFKELGTFTVPVAAGETFGSFSIVVEGE